MIVGFHGFSMKVVFLLNVVQSALMLLLLTPCIISLMDTLSTDVSLRLSRGQFTYVSVSW